MRLGRFVRTSSLVKQFSILQIQKSSKSSYQGLDSCSGSRLRGVAVQDVQSRILDVPLPRRSTCHARHDDGV